MNDTVVLVLPGLATVQPGRKHLNSVEKNVNRPREVAGGYPGTRGGGERMGALGGLLKQKKSTEFKTKTRCYKTL